MFFVGGGVGSDLWHRLGKSGNSGRAGHDNNGINFNKKNAATNYINYCQLTSIIIKADANHLSYK